MACTISAQTRLEPTPSICEITNFLLVSATVTTSTMEALPMITPRDVSVARSLLERERVDGHGNSFADVHFSFYLSRFKASCTGLFLGSSCRLGFVLTARGGIAIVPDFRTTAQPFVRGRGCG